MSLGTTDFTDQLPLDLAPHRLAWFFGREDRAGPPNLMQSVETQSNGFRHVAGRFDLG